MIEDEIICSSLVDAESVRGSDRQREAEAEGFPRLMPTDDQQQEMAAMQERAPRLLLTCTAQRTAARFLVLVLYSCLLKCFSRAGAVAATALAYILTLLASQVLSLPHGPWCRLATTAAASAPAAKLWNMHLGACVFIIVVSLPSPWLWWAPKKTYQTLVKELAKVETWAMDNKDELRRREGKCFKDKLRQNNGGEERRIYKFLANHEVRLEASAALAAKLRKLGCMVLAPGDTDLHAAVPSEASRSPNAMVRNTGAMGSAVSLSTSSEYGQARGSSSAVSSVREAAEAEGPPRLKRARSSAKVTADPPLPTGPFDYFERQSGAWCGMHALNNLVRGPMVNEDACRAAAKNVRESLFRGDSERAHLDPETGFLSIDVINMLGSANLGIHVEGSPYAWEVLRDFHGARALINWNQTHWTVLEAWPPDAPTRWRHTNSVEKVKSGLRYGRAH